MVVVVAAVVVVKVVGMIIIIICIRFQASEDNKALWERLFGNVLW